MSDVLRDAPTLAGSLDATNMRVAIIVSRFNGFVTERLLEGAMDTLTRSGAAAADTLIVRVPGAWELPQTAAKVLAGGGFDAVIALGCLIRGDTIHFDLIASEVAKGLSGLGRESGIPVIFGVLTTDNLEQSVHRAGAKFGNKGGEAAMAAIEQVSLYRALESRGPGSSTLAAPTTKTKRRSSKTAKKKAR